MSRLFKDVFWIIFFYCFSISIGDNIRVPLDISADEVKKEALFAVSELTKLSSSNIYNTITLQSILKAERNEGIYHLNTIILLELASPYFKSKKETEIFEMIVMTHKDDEIRSFAIDEFPVMDEDAIETFWNEKVEEKRKLREESFRRLELEALLIGEVDFETDITKSDIFKQTHSESLQTLMEKIDHVRIRKLQETYSKNLQSRLQPNLLKEELELNDLDLFQLYQITVNAREASDFQKYRAQQILDDAMKQAKSSKFIV